MEVRAKKALGQHFLTDQNIAKSIVAALQLPAAGGKAVASEGKVNAEVAEYRSATKDIKGNVVPVKTLGKGSYKRTPKGDTITLEPTSGIIVRL